MNQEIMKLGEENETITKSKVSNNLEEMILEDRVLRSERLV
jgi:hypothetical protein